MSDHPRKTARHGQMFELLRQKERAQEICVIHKLRHTRVQPDATPQADLQALAIRSLRRA